ncbi:hypothetical protein [Stenotrophomonas maltophilia group sp. CASM26]|uniref:hypothetical protein n=1 Tax=Stenotrophomonas maltophilia group sp. CASM26 TaxID=3111514 RepID=UPI003BF787A1
MKKIYPLTLALLAALATVPAFANSATGTVTANVPSTCEIMSVDDVHADLSQHSAQLQTGGSIQVICNKDAGYSITTSTVDANGRFAITAVSGTSGATMEVELRETATGNTWSNSDIVGGTGTGLTQSIGFQLVYNPSGGPIPAYGFYTGPLTFDLTSTF